MDFPILKQFYEALMTDDVSVLDDLHIPHSDVFFVRAALNAKFPELGPFSLERTEQLLKEEGIKYGGN